jgi:ribosome biogenesis protein BMS1
VCVCVCVCLCEFTFSSRETTTQKKKKQHRARQSGTKADKKQKKKDTRSGKGKVKGQNPKAFGRSSAGITARIQQSRKAEIQERKLHAPLIDRSYAAEEPPPIVVGVVVR